MAIASPTMRSPRFGRFAVLLLAASAALLLLARPTQSFGFTGARNPPRFAPAFQISGPVLRNSNNAGQQQQQTPWPSSRNSAMAASRNNDDKDLLHESSLVDTTATFRRKLVRALPSAALLASAAAVLIANPAASSAAAEVTTEAAALFQYSDLLEKLTDSGFYQAFSLVFLSEIGDKTFFVAGLLAAKLSRFVSFVGSLGALAVMTVISVCIGQAFHAVPAGIANGVPLDDVAAVLAFTYFGIKILAEALEMEEGDGIKTTFDEELEDAEEAVESTDIETNTKWAQIASIFALVFAAEFGDRSFIATIALSAAQDPVSVAAGAVAAHAVATGIAVVGGAYIAKYVPERVLGIVGGLLFLVFAATTAVGIF